MEVLFKVEWKLSVQYSIGYQSFRKALEFPPKQSRTVLFETPTVYGKFPFNKKIKLNENLENIPKMSPLKYIEVP